MPKAFTDLKVWQKAIDLTTMIYELTGDYPQREVYGLTAQMRRAAVSVANNIAEGSARGTAKDFRQFIKMAKGSISELETQLIISGRLAFGDQVKREKAEALSREIGRMLSGLSNYLTERIRTEQKCRKDVNVPLATKN